MNSLYNTKLKLAGWILACLTLGTYISMSGQGMVAGVNTVNPQSSGAEQHPASTTPTVPSPTITQTITPTPILETKWEDQVVVIDYTSRTIQDPSIDQGQKKTIQNGALGSKLVKWQVSYRDGIEQNRVIQSQTITKQPVDQIISIGTKTHSSSTPTASSCSNGYKNAAGNCVASPGSNPSGATAICKDGTYSYSQTRKGTCSHHGGVSSWL